MKQLVNGINKFIKEDEGVTMVEYGLMAALVAVACIAAIGTLAGGLQTIFTNIGNCLKAPTAANCTF